MCLKTPKLKKVTEKPVQYLRNPYLDGLAIGANSGRNSLRIDRGGASGPPLALTPPGTDGGLAVPTVPARGGFLQPGYGQFQIR